MPVNAARRCRDGKDKETKRQDSLSPHGTCTHIDSRLGGEQDETERKAKRELVLLLDYPPLPMPAAVFPARRGWRRVGWVQPDCLRRASETTAREREGGRGRWDGNGEWVYPPRYPVNVCACMAECMNVRERGRMGRRERDRSGAYVRASLPRQCQWIETEEHSRCVKCRVPPPYITLTQRSAQSAQHLTIWRNNGFKEEQRERERGRHKKGDKLKLKCV